MFTFAYLDELGVRAIAAFFAPWPTLNLLVAAFLLLARPTRIRPLAKVLAGVLGASSWVLVRYFGSFPPPEKLEGNELWHHMQAWAVACSLAALSIIFWDSGAARSPAARSAARSRT